MKKQNTKNDIITKKLNEKKKNKTYHNTRPMKSRNPIMGIVTGKRSKGKTYAYVRDALNDYLNGKGQFLYLRRYKKELGRNKKNFLFYIINEFPEYTWRVVGCEVQIGKKMENPKNIRYETAGYMFTLTEEEDIKGTPLDIITTIIFDEFIIKKGSYKRYLQDEFTDLMSIYDTVDRELNKTRMYLLGNSLNFSNPYFIELGLKIEEFKNNEFVKRNNGDTIIQIIPEDYDEAEEINNTSWSGRIAPERYNKMARHNKFMEENDDFIIEQKKQNIEDMELLYIIFNGKNFFLVYDDFSSTQRRLLLISITNHTKYNIDKYSIDIKKPHVGFIYNDKIKTFLKNQLFKNNIVFNNIKSRENFINNI